MKICKLDANVMKVDAYKYIMVIEIINTRDKCESCKYI